jgi:radical SAM superfamily enzyme YgiQ (UPF0313 family)
LKSQREAPDVFLVATPHGFVKREPLGAAYCAASLRSAGFRSSILAETAGQTYSASEIASRSLESGAPIIGFSITSPACSLAFKAIEAIKQGKPQAVIIVGGYHPTLTDRQTLEHCPGIDFVVRGEGEQTLPELVSCILRREDPLNIRGISYRANGKIRVNENRPPIKDLDSLPFPARDLLPDPRRYRPFYNNSENRFEVKASVSSSRGCPHRCSFCSIVSFYEQTGHAGWRSRSPANLFKELEELATTYGVQHVNFCDDNFLVSKSRAMEIASHLKGGESGITFALNARAEQIVNLGEEGLRILKEAGLRAVEIGIESGSQSVLDRYDKRTTVEMNRRALDRVNEAGIKAEIDFILFDPWTTFEELKENLDFIERMLPANYPFRKILHTELLLNPGSPVQTRFLKAIGEEYRAHEVVPYSIKDPRAAGVFEGMDEFLKRVRPKLDRIDIGIEEIHRGLDSAGSNKDFVRKFLGEAIFFLIPINRMSLKFFKRLLSIWEKGEGSAADVNAITGEYAESAEKLEEGFLKLKEKYSS